VTGTGVIASYSARFWTLVIGLGVIAGLSASGLVWLLRHVEQLSFGVHRPTLLAAVEATPHLRRVTVLLAAALITIVGLRVLGRSSTGGTEVTEAIWLRSGKLDFVRSLARGVLSIVIVGMGVSLGREAGPQVFGAAFASRAAKWAELPVWQRRLLVASGAGAGFAAVYNVPLGGALLALEVMLGTLVLALVLPTLLMCLTATAVAWIFLGDRPLYYTGNVRFHTAQIVFAILIGPVIGLVATGWTRLISWANRRRPEGRGRWFAPIVAFGILGLLSLQYPQLLGNGRAIVQLGIIGNLSLGLMLMLLLLKPLVTAGCIASGAPGGLFTPTFAVGVLFANVCGVIWSHVWHGAIPSEYALIGGAAFLAAAMQGPLAGVVIVLELTRHFGSLMVPTLLAVVGATVMSRRIGAASIYSARIQVGGVEASSPSTAAASEAAIHKLDEPMPAEFERRSAECD